MESLIAALIGWISIEDEIINLQTGQRIKNITGDDNISRAEVIYPNGDIEEYSGEAADAFFDRGEALAIASDAFLKQLDILTKQAQGAQL